MRFFGITTFRTLAVSSVLMGLSAQTLAGYVANIVDAPIIGPAPFNYGNVLRDVSPLNAVGKVWRGRDEAYLWTFPTSKVSLHRNDAVPGSGILEYVSSDANALAGTYQAGRARARYPSNVYRNHAVRWQGTAASMVDLHPFGFAESVCEGAAFIPTFGLQIGGWADTSTTVPYRPRAMYWEGTSTVANNLHPSTASYSRILGVSATNREQIGLAGILGYMHAIKWSGSAASFVDLHPSGSFYTASWARASAFGQQVGTASYYYFEVEYRHATKWNGTAASMTSLNPSIALSSEAFDTNHTQQVGYFVQPYGNPHAIVWNGSSTSYTDLHLALPAGGNYTHSYATAISNSTGVISGYAKDIYGTQHAVLWYPV